MTRSYFLDGEKLGDVGGLHFDLAHLELEVLEPFGENSPVGQLVFVTYFRRLVILDCLKPNSDMIWNKSFRSYDY